MSALHQAEGQLWVCLCVFSSGTVAEGAVLTVDMLFSQWDSGRKMQEQVELCNHF